MTRIGRIGADLFGLHPRWSAAPASSAFYFPVHRYV